MTPAYSTTARALTTALYGYSRIEQRVVVLRPRYSADGTMFFAFVKPKGESGSYYDVNRFELDRLLDGVPAEELGIRALSDAEIKEAGL